MDQLIVLTFPQFEDAKNALDAGKHVLLEKVAYMLDISQYFKLLLNDTYLQPATLNQAEFKVLSDLAKSKNLFLMEAVWTRFFPLTYALEKVLFEEKAIGDIRRLQSDFSIDFIDSELPLPTIQNLDLT